MVTEVDKFLSAHNVDVVKDLLVPSFQLDKIIAFVAIYYAIRTFRKTNEIAEVNLFFQLNAAHREIWTGVLSTKSNRITDPDADPSNIKPTEERYIIFLLLHVHSLYEASRKKQFDFNSAIRLDVGTFFNKPLPNKVWENKKQFYSARFRKFLDNVKVEVTQPPSSRYSRIRNLVSNIFSSVKNAFVSLRRKILRVVRYFRDLIIN